MKSLISLTLAAAFALAAPGVASAGIYADDLGKCLVSKTSPDDQRKLLVWVFGTMSAHPDVKAFTTISEAQRKVQNQAAGSLYEQLLTERCRKETVAALKYEGPTALESAFSVLGQVAMRSLMGHPDVASRLQDLGTAVDINKLQALAKEAGIAAK